MSFGKSDEMQFRVRRTDGRELPYMDSSKYTQAGQFGIILDIASRKYIYEVSSFLAFFFSIFIFFPAVSQYCASS